MLIAFSGLDGAGKSTQIQMLMKVLREEGKKPVYLWTRGGYTTMFNALKSVMRRLSKGRALPPSGRSQERNRAFSKPWVRFLWLQIAVLDLIWLFGIQVRIWTASGKTVVCDRYLWDTLVDFRLNFAQNSVENMLLWKLLVAVTPKPDASFLMMIPVAESLRRSEQKSEPFPDSAEVLEARREQYLSLSKIAGWQVIDCMQPISSIGSQILTSLPIKTQRFQSSS